jgi:hypothetical protein
MSLILDQIISFFVSVWAELKWKRIFFNQDIYVKVKKNYLHVFLLQKHDELIQDMVHVDLIQERHHDEVVPLCSCFSFYAAVGSHPILCH